MIPDIYAVLLIVRSKDIYVFRGFDNIETKSFHASAESPLINNRNTDIVGGRSGVYWKNIFRAAVVVSESHETQCKKNISSFHSVSLWH